MDITLLLVRLLIASVFLIAAVAKVADLRGTRDAVVAFGVPTGLAIPVGVALPLAEFAVAAALVVHDWAYAGALGAIGLLLAFCVGIGWNLARGQAPECHCFGQLHSATISWITLARNGALAAAAGVVLSMGRDDPGASAIGWIQGLSITEHVALVGSLVVGAALLAQGRLIRHVLEQNGLLVTRLELLESILTPGPETTDSATSSDHRRAPLPVGLPVGAIAPRFELSDLDGSRHTLTGLCERGKPVVLVFSDPNCGPCTALLPEIGTWQRKYGEQISLVVISRGSQDANRQRAITHGITPLLIQHDREVADAFQVLGTPSAVIVTPDGTIGSHLASGSGAIAALVSRSAIPDVGPTPTLLYPTNGQIERSHAHAAIATRDPVGLPMPTVVLPDLDGHLVDLAEFASHELLILFWNPQCGFCQRMLSDLQALESQFASGTSPIVVVSAGTAEENRALGLRSTIVLDEGFRTGRVFGASGTPSAFRVDDTGRIGSPLAVGAPAVLALVSSITARSTPSIVG